MNRLIQWYQRFWCSDRMPERWRRIRVEDFVAYCRSHRTYLIAHGADPDRIDAIVAEYDAAHAPGLKP